MNYKELKEKQEAEVIDNVFSFMLWSFRYNWKD